MKKTFGRLQRLSLWSFKRPRQTALIWLILAIFGATCYGTLLKREGFPSVNTPFAIASGSYLVNDSSKVDHDVAEPLSAYLLKQPKVKSVQTQSAGNFYTVIVSYKDKTDAGPISKTLSRKINKRKLLPAQATLQFSPYEFGFTQRGDDVVVSFYSPGNSVSTRELTAKAQKAASFIRSKHLPLVKRVSIINQYELATNPLTGLKESNQKTFGRFGQHTDGRNKFYQSVVIGVKAKPHADNLELDKQVRSAVSELNARPGVPRLPRYRQRQLRAADKRTDRHLAKGSAGRLGGGANSRLAGDSRARIAHNRSVHDYGPGHNQRHTLPDRLQP